MYLPLVESDQLYTWSDTCARENLFHFAETPPISSAATAPTYRDPPWFTHRTLQALWQAGLQVRQGARSRPQVLPVGKLSPFAPPNGLCAAGVSRPDREVSCQLSAGARDLRGNLRDQSRTTAPARGALRNRDERNVFLALRTHRSGIGRRPPRQYARGLARRPSGLPDHRGGDR